MNEKQLEKFSYFITMPKSLKLNDFNIIIDLQKKVELNNSKLIPLSSFEEYKKFAYFILLINIDKSDILNLVTYFMQFSKRTSNLIRFKDWEDAYFSILGNVIKFTFLIPNLKNFCDFYKIKFHPDTINNEIKNIFLNI